MIGFAIVIAGVAIIIDYKAIVIFDRS